MTDVPDSANRLPGCPADCDRCAAAVGCDGAGPDDEPVLRGWGFASASVGYFLLPLVLAGVGAAAGGTPLGQLIGGSAGLAVGMAGAGLIARRGRVSEEDPWL